MPPRIGKARRHTNPLNFMPSVAIKRRTPAPIPLHGTYRHRKRLPPWRAERRNPHSGSTVALRGFVQDGFCNGCPLPAHAAIVLAISHHRNLNIARRILYGSVEPYPPFVLQTVAACLTSDPSKAVRDRLPRKGRLIRRSLADVHCGVDTTGKSTTRVILLIQMINAPNFQRRTVHFCDKMQHKQPSGLDEANLNRGAWGGDILQCV